MFRKEAAMVLVLLASALGGASLAAGAEAAPGDITVSLVKDLAPGTAGSPDTSEPMAILGNNVFFSADDASGIGRELWRSDGTSAGTVLVKDINSDTGQSGDAEQLLVVNGTLLFAARETTASGRELWKSDGTTAGTVKVEEINSTGSSAADVFTAVGDTLLFRATDGTSGQEMWKSSPPYDAASTALIEDITTPGDGTGQATAVSSTTALFSPVDSDGAGQELWKTTSPFDSSATELVEDINLGTDESPPDPDSSVPSGIRSVGGTAFFAASDGASGVELWKSAAPYNSTSTSRVADINPTGDSVPGGFTAVGSTVYFSADDGTNGRELWKSVPPYDSTSTSLVANINGDSGDSLGFNPDMGTIGGRVVFSANDGSSGNELWSSNGGPLGPGGTFRVRDINVGPAGSDFDEPVPFAGRVFFVANDDVANYELWSTDGLAATRAADINSGANGSFPRNFAERSGTLFFHAFTDGTGNELFKATVEGPAGPTPPFPTPPPQGSSPSNSFKFARITASRNGALTISLTLPGPGKVAAKATANVKRSLLARRITVARRSATARRAGTLKLRLKAGRLARRVLRRRGSLRAKLTVTYRPTGGKAKSARRTVRFKLRKRR